jgi:serine/threonine protein kinase
MPAPASVAEFLELVDKSGVLDETRYGAYSAYLTHLRDAGSLPSDITKLAGLLVRDGHLTYFQAEQLLMGKWKRFTIGKYKVLERLGSGGMGQVFLCEHKHMRRRVAVKVLPTAKAEDPSSLERFYREARAVAALDHPNLVRAYDIDTDDHLHFLVIEFVDGSSLQDILKKTGGAPMDILRACHYVSQSAVGLHHAHAIGLIHRDIKPGNILVDRTGTVKILDMGLARFFNDEEDLLTKKYDENVLGTADYLAPEQAVDSHAVDIRADIYSLGATFYFLLTGDPPFKDGTVAQKLIWHQTRQPRPVRALRPEVPEALAAVLNKMLAKDVSQRYQTPAEVVQALAPWTATPVGPPPDDEMPQLSPAALGTGPVSMTANLSAGGPARIPGPSTPAPGGAAPRAVSTLSSQFTLPAVPPPSPSHPGYNPAPPAPRTAAPAPSRAGYTPAAGLPAVTARPAVKEEPAASPFWESLTASAETKNTAKVDTDRQNTPSSSPRPAATLTPKPRRPARKLPPRKTMLIAVAVLGALLLAWAVWAIFFRGPSGGTNPSGARVLQVSKQAGPAGYRTLRDAVAAAQPGDRIVLLDDEIEGQLFLDGKPTAIKDKVPRDVTIEAGNAAKRVVWHSGGKVPCLGVDSVEGLKLTGVSFDGQGVAGELLRVLGKCPGLTVEACEFANFADKVEKDTTYRAHGVRFYDCSGEADSPVTLDGLRFVAAKSTEAAVALLSGGKSPNQFLRVRNCRIEGLFGAAFRVEGSLTDVTFERNRLFEVSAGWLFKRPRSAGKDYTLADVRVVSNTLVKVPDAFRFEDAAQPASGQPALLVAQNYFAQVSNLVKVEAGAAPPAVVARDNARDAATKENPALPLGASEVANYQITTDPKSNNFLRYPRTAPLAAVGPNKLPAGVPPD